MNKKFNFYIFIISALLFLSSCQGVMNSTGKYEKDILSFSYSSGWKVEDVVREGKETKNKQLSQIKQVRQVYITGANRAILVINLLPPESSVNLDVFAAEMGERYKSGQFSENAKNETSKITKNINGKNFEGVRIKTHISVLGKEDLNYTSEFFLLKTEKADILLTFQSPDEVWESSSKEFQMILDSLRYM